MRQTPSSRATTLQVLDDFFAVLRHARRRLLMLDYDGTLASFTADRADAVPYLGVVERLRAIARSGSTRLVVVTGRAAADLDRLLGLDPPPEIWGVHGRERRFPDGRTERWPMTPAAAEGLRAANRWGHAVGLASSLEEKPGALALHWRGLNTAETEAARAAASRDWPDLARHARLELREFDGGLELRAPGPHKGDVVRTLLAEAAADPSAGATEAGDRAARSAIAAAYLGDDLTDEDAFRTLRDAATTAARGEGADRATTAAARKTAGLGPIRALSALVRPHWRPTDADIWLRPPVELLAFLDQWAGADRPGGRAREPDRP